MPTEKRQRQKEGRQKRLEAQRKQSRRKRLVRRSVIVVIIAAIVGYTAYKLEAGSPAAPLTAQQKSNLAAVSAGCPSSPTARVNTIEFKHAPRMSIHKSLPYFALVETDLGSFTIRLTPKLSPVTVNNFIFLAKHDYYQCNTFFRVIPGFVNQTGDPTGAGGGSPGYTIPDEFPKKAKNSLHQYRLGAVAMAEAQTHHSGGAQFFIVAGPNGEQLSNGFPLIGQVTSGISVVEAINADGKPTVANVQNTGEPPVVVHRILSITISTRS